jgi:membrane protease YdiL (CAAX protease family)
MTTAGDYPFYNGQPVDLGLRGWLIVIAAVLVAFFQLILLPLSGPVLGFIPPIILSALPLAALAFVAGKHWTALFRPYGIKQFGLSVLFSLLTLVITFAVGLAMSQVLAMSPNPALAGEASTVDLVLLLVRAAIQLVGEEAVTILPLLAVTWLCVTRFGLSRRMGLLVGVVVSTVWFSAMHLPTYDWNILQCLGAIGTARLVLTASYLVTRNMGVSIGAHILNDWALFFISFVGSHGPIEAAGT